METLPAPTSAAGAVLPAPFYAIGGGQVTRIERDGTTQITLTNEPSEGAALAIVDLAVSLDGRALVYQTQKPAGGSALIRTDGSGRNRSVLFDQPDSVASHPIWSPDGAHIAASISGVGDVIGGGGLYLLPLDGSVPKRLHANSVISVTDTTAAVDPNAVGYTPVSFSPDGSHILVSRYALQLEECGLAIIPTAGGEPVLIKPPSADLRSTCGPAVWSADGSAIYTTFVPDGGPYYVSAGVWRVDATTGNATPVVPSQANGKYTLIKMVSMTTTDELRAEIGSADSVPLIGEGGDIVFHLVRLDSRNGTWTQLSDEASTNVEIAWSPDGSGALVQTPGANGLSTLAWQPLDGSPSTPLGAHLELTGVQWGRP